MYNSTKEYIQLSLQLFSVYISQPGECLRHTLHYSDFIPCENTSSVLLVNLDDSILA